MSTRTKTPDQVIYFPYINVPQNDWFSRVLLYWDQIGCIVPEDYEPDEYSAYVPDKLLRPLGPERLAYTTELFEVGLVKPVNPAYLHWTDEFLELLDDLFRPRRRTRFEEQSAVSVPVHVGKLGHDLTAELRRRSLAEPPSAGSPWCLVERQTATLFMAFMAASLGADEDMLPITDDLDSLAAFGYVRHGAGTERSADLRQGFLEAVLPAPSSSVRPVDLSDFKHEYSKQLLKLRRNIEFEVKALSLVTDEKERVARAALIQTKLADDSGELAELMSARRWGDIAYGGLGVVGPAAGVALAASSLATSGGVLTAVAALASLVVGIRGAVSGGPQEYYLDQPLAYAALAQRRFASGA